VSRQIRRCCKVSSLYSYSKWPLQRNLVPLDTLDRLCWDRSLAVNQLWCNVDRFPLHWCLGVPSACILKQLILYSYLSSREDILDGLRNFGSDTISLNQTDCVKTLMERQHAHPLYISSTVPIESIAMLSTLIVTPDSFIAAGRKALHRNPSGHGTWRLSPSLRNRWHIVFEPVRTKQSATVKYTVGVCSLISAARKHT
jgi:hypothetical protein